MCETSKEAKEKWKKTWERIGKQNIWIVEAYDPPFNTNSIFSCETLKELKAKFEHGNWCLGQAYNYRNFCFIQQINGGDEWLSIKDGFVFESASLGRMIETGSYDEWMNRVMTAPDENLQSLTY